MAFASSPAMGGSTADEPEPTLTVTTPTETALQPPAGPQSPVAKVPAVSPQPALNALKKAALRDLKKKTVIYRKSAWRWQKLMGLSQTHASPLSARTKSVPYAKWVLNLWKTRSKRLYKEARNWMAAKIVSYKQTVRHWSLVTGKDFVGKPKIARRTASASPRSLEAEYNRWRKITKAVLKQVSNPPRFSEFNCIYRYERNPAQGWSTQTGNGYYGGLQMDLSFQRAYGGYLLSKKGTANNWTPLEQVWVAEKAYSSGRGFYPWPNTARSCGLI